MVLQSQAEDKRALGRRGAPRPRSAPQWDALRRPSRDSLHLRVYNELRRALIAGVFLPGQPVTLRQLVKSLGTSIMPVRDAVGRLIAAGALEMLPNRSVIVPLMTRRKFTELSRLRQALEGMAAEEACRRMDPQAFARVKKINEAVKKAIASGDREKAFLRNRDFHFSIYESSKLQVALPLIDALWLQAAPFLCLSLVKHEAHWDAKHHDAAVAALSAGKPSAVRRAVECDIKATLTHLLDRGVFAQSD